MVWPVDLRKVGLGQEVRVEAELKLFNGPFGGHGRDDKEPKFLVAVSEELDGDAKPLAKFPLIDVVSIATNGLPKSELLLDPGNT
ncbi:hypothetical protein TWF281_003817 [Arthrobotrys megalospora]